MTYLLDTNACIRYLNGQSEAIMRRLQQVPPDEVAVCAVVKAELLVVGVR
jgi:tRNA(fMet)-specific endonuclease VapC